jgi:hypothetical protein
VTDQLALQVDVECVVEVVERRGGEERTVAVGPLPEPQAHALVTLLLNRAELPPGPGPWRLAMAGGTRTVTLRAAS